MGCSPWGYMTACVREDGGRWVGSNKVLELKKKKDTLWLSSMQSCIVPESTTTHRGCMHMTYLM